MGNVLQQDRFTRARWRNDQRSLAFAQRCHQINHPRRQILLVGDFNFHPQTLIGVERCQVIEVRLMLDLLGVFKIDRVDLQERKITLSILRPADRPLHSIPRFQGKPPDLRR